MKGKVSFAFVVVIMFLALAFLSSGCGKDNSTGPSPAPTAVTYDISYEATAYFVDAGGTTTEVTGGQINVLFYVQTIGSTSGGPAFSSEVTPYSSGHLSVTKGKEAVLRVYTIDAAVTYIMLTTKTGDITCTYSATNGHLAGTNFTFN